MFSVRIKIPLLSTNIFPLKELEDHDFFPAVLRNFQTDFIGFVVSRFNVYCVFVQHLKILSLPVQPMIDLCSGSGEPAIGIYRKSNCFGQLILSDKFPRSLKLNEAEISYVTKSIDVLDMEFKSGMCYTMFNAFHHFEDKDKLKISEKIIRSDSSAFFVEILEPNIFCFLKIIVVTIFGSLFLTPFIKPFSFKRLFFTYIIPVNVLTILFDGILSVFKSRSAEHYQKLFSEHKDAVEVLRFKNGLNPLIVIQILPKK